MGLHSAKLLLGSPRKFQKQPVGLDCKESCYIKTKKSCIGETKHLLTDADSSTDTTIGWTKNTQQPNFFEKWKKSSKTQKTQTFLEICQN